MPRVNRYSLDVVRNAVLAPPSMELCQTASGTCAGTYYSVRGIRGISKSVGKTSATTTITIKEFPLEFGRDLASRQQGRDLLPQSALSPLQCRIRMTNRFAKRYTPYYFSLEFQENIALRRSDPGTSPRNVRNALHLQRLLCRLFSSAFYQIGVFRQPQPQARGARGQERPPPCLC